MCLFVAPRGICQNGTSVPERATARRPSLGSRCRDLDLCKKVGINAAQSSGAPVLSLITSATRLHCYWQYGVRRSYIHGDEENRRAKEATNISRKKKGVRINADIILWYVGGGQMKDL